MANYAVTDLHGMKDLWLQIKNYCKPDDKIYFLGDAADRGPDGVEIILDLLKDERVTYLKGNHEDMLVMVIKQVLNRDFRNLSWWQDNGGAVTCLDVLSLKLEEQKELLEKLDNLPDHMVISNAKGQNIFLSHAGTALDYDNYELYFIKGEPYLWDRRHFRKPWPKSESYSNWYIVHGHTPCQILSKELNEIEQFYDKVINYPENEIISYADGHKFDLDLASFASNRIALFNLDELKVEKYFEL